MRGLTEKMSLKRQLTYIACLCVLIPLLVSSFLLHGSAVDAYAQVSLRAGQMSLQQASELVEKACNQAVNAADMLLSDQKLMDLMHMESESYPMSQRIDDIRDIRNKLVSLEAENAVQGVRLVWMQDIRWISGNGYISLGLSQFQTLLDQNGIQTDNGLLPGPVWLPKSELSAINALFSYDTITYARMIRSITDFDRLLGYVVVMQTRDMYAGLLRQADLSDDALLTLCDASGQVLAQGGGWAEPGALWDAYTDQSMPSSKLHYNSGTVQVLERTLKDTGWRLVALLPLNEYQSNVLWITIRTIALVVLLTLAALLLANLLYRSILRRIERIICCMERVEQGDLTAMLPAEGGDELGRIERHFNRMLTRMDTLLRKTQDMAERDRLLRIRLLQTQINPHFLYNAINSIMWTAMDYHADKVCKMLKALSDFYKIGLQPGCEEASLEHELMHAQRYVALQNLRGKPQVDMFVDCDESLYDLMVPNMMLQPLVENSIIHGFAGRENGKLSIKVKCECSMLSIEISDDGKGMTQEECDRLLLRELPGHSYGIYSIFERLRLRYGERADLKLKSNSKKPGLVTEIMIPQGE
jgi:sensor histidine kinase YesM